MGRRYRRKRFSLVEVDADGNEIGPGPEPLLGPFFRKLGGFIDEVLQESEARHAAPPPPRPKALPAPKSAREDPEDLIQILAEFMLQADTGRPALEAVAGKPSPAPLKPAPPAKPEPDPRWRSIITHPAIVLILGKLGSGKSALAYFLLELFRYQLNLFVVGVPQGARQLLPPWIGIAAMLEDVPPKSIALVDESYLRYHSRGSMAAESKAMSQLLSLSRQRELTIVLVSPDSRQIDINIASSATVIITKEPGAMRLEFERRELRPRLERASTQFGAVGGDKRGWSYVYAPDVDFEGMLQNPLPSFWSPRLSKLFASGQEPAPARRPKRPSAEERAREAQRLDALGFSNAEIARTIGVSKATVVNYLRGYPYRRPRK